MIGLKPRPWTFWLGVSPVPLFLTASFSLGKPLRVASFDVIGGAGVGLFAGFWNGYLLIAMSIYLSPSFCLASVPGRRTEVGPLILPVLAWRS